MYMEFSFDSYPLFSSWSFACTKSIIYFHHSCIMFLCNFSFSTRPRRVTPSQCMHFIYSPARRRKSLFVSNFNCKKANFSDLGSWLLLLQSFLRRKYEKLALHWTSVYYLSEVKESVCQFYKKKFQDDTHAQVMIKYWKSSHRVISETDHHHHPQTLY